MNDSLLPPKWILTLIGVALIVWLVVTLKELVVLLVVGYLIAYLIEPAVMALERQRVPRSIGVVAVGVVGLLTVMGLIASSLPTLFRQYHRLSENLPAYLERATARLQPLLPQELPAPLAAILSGESLLSVVPKIDVGVITKVGEGALAVLFQGYSLTLAILNLVLLPFIVFYLSEGFHPLHRSLVRLLPWSVRGRWVAIAREIDRYVSAYIRGQLSVCSILFVLYAVGLALVGIDLWFLVAVIAGFGNLIPYVGTVVGGGLAIIMALATFGSLGSVVGVVLVFVFVQALEGTLITPRIVGSSVGLSPLAVIIALTAGGMLAGLLGLVLAIPAAAALRVLSTHLLIASRERNDAAPAT